MNEMEANGPEGVAEILVRAGVPVSPVEISLLAESSPKIHGLVQHLRDPALRDSEPAVVFCSQPVQPSHSVTEARSSRGEAD